MILVYFLILSYVLYIHVMLFYTEMIEFLN